VSDDDDDDDKFNQDDASPQPLELQNPAQMAFEERMLSYLNNCNAIQLMAIANIRADNAEVMLKHQPFATLDDARNVVVTKKSARKKVAKVALGDDVVDSIESYARALDGIDRIVGVCEQQGVAVAAATSRWNLDFTGSDKNTKAAIEDDRPPTPASMGSPAKQLKALPISKEPRLMRGHCTMKPYQLYGLNWMYLLYERSFGGILADDMGLGKTCQVISLMCAVVEQFEDSGVDEDNRPWPNLIVVPPSTLSNWEAEFKKFAPDMNVISYSGGQQDRDEVADEVLENPANYHVILTTYSQLGRAEDIDNLKRIRPMIAVFDEGHKLKNPKTKLYKDLIRLTASWRLLLTGTPVQNNLMEMVALLRFIEPDLFREHFADLEALFNQKVSLQDVSNGALLYSERVTRARSILEPFILQRRKEQVLMSLPPKTSRMVYCELDKTQKKIYDGYERYFRRGKDLRPAAPEPKGTDPDLNNIWMQLRKSAIHPQLFRRWFTDEKVAEMANILMRKIDQSILQQDNLGHLVAELKNCSDFELHLWCRDYPCIRKFDIPELSFMKSGKIQELLKLIREYEQNGDKVLVFTRFAKVIEILRECLATEDIEYVALQGNTNVGDRQELIDQFQGDPSITAFLLTTGAGGTGINLTAANKVIVFDQSDNPQDDLQAENRAHRLGQTRPVEIIKLISKDTIEELVHAACEKKIELANRVTGWRGGHVTITAGEMEETIRKELMARDNITPPSSD
jgi:SWI/SNF-related matrix-associated actin-dependent regulator 1 of chromatin subfamily A